MHSFWNVLQKNLHIKYIREDGLVTKVNQMIKYITVGYGYLIVFLCGDEWWNLNNESRFVVLLHTIFIENTYTKVDRRGSMKLSFK